MLNNPWYLASPIPQRPHLELTLLRNTLEGMGQIISNSQRHLADADHEQIFVMNVEDGALDGEINWIENYQNILIENMLGAAFVLCQTYITLVVSEITKLHDWCHQNQINLTTTQRNKASIMAYGTSLQMSQGVSNIEVMNAAANHFKHHEEWSGSWATLSNQAALTVRVLQAIGLTESSITLYRTAAQALGISDLANLQRFELYLQVWMTDLFDAYDRELRQLGVF